MARVVTAVKLAVKFAALVSANWLLRLFSSPGTVDPFSTQPKKPPKSRERA
jgi:hypothetical protein